MLSSKSNIMGFAAERSGNVVVYNKAKVGSEVIEPGMTMSLELAGSTKVFIRTLGVVYSVFHGQAPKQSKRSFCVLYNVDSNVCSKHDIDLLVDAKNWEQCSMSESELRSVTTKCISQFIEPYMTTAADVDEKADDVEEVPVRAH